MKDVAFVSFRDPEGRVVFHFSRKFIRPLSLDRFQVLDINDDRAVDPDKFLVIKALDDAAHQLPDQVLLPVGIDLRISELAHRSVNYRLDAKFSQ